MTVAKTILLTNSDNKHVKMVLNCASAKEIWDRLSMIHEQKSRSTKIVLQKEFYDFHFGQNERIHNYISRAEHVSSKLNDVGVNIDQSTLVSKILGGLTDDYMSFVSNWMGTDDDHQTIDHLLPRLLAEKELRSKFEKNDTMAYAAKGKFVKNYKRNQVAKYSEKKFEKNTEPEFKCFECHKVRHFKRNCPKRSSSRPSRSKWQPSTSRSDASSSNNTSTAIMVETSNSKSKSLSILEQHIRRHLTIDISLFTDYRAFQKSKSVINPAKQQLIAVGWGDVEVLSSINDKVHKITLKDTWYVQDLETNYLSIASAIQKGCEILMIVNRLNMRSCHDGPVIIMSTRQNDTFKTCFDIPTKTSFAIMAEANNSTNDENTCTLDSGATELMSNDSSSMINIKG